MAVEHDIIPLNGADVFQQGEINSIGDRVALTSDQEDFARLPVDDARQDQVQAAAVVGCWGATEQNAALRILLPNTHPMFISHIELSALGQPPES